MKANESAVDRVVRGELPQELQGWRWVSPSRNLWRRLGCLLWPP